MSTSNQFIFGYGSLVESQSRARTSPSALYAFPVNVAGIKRGWLDQVGGAQSRMESYEICSRRPVVWVVRPQENKNLNREKYSVTSPTRFIQ